MSLLTYDLAVTLCDRLGDASGAMAVVVDCSSVDGTSGWDLKNLLTNVCALSIWYTVVKSTSLPSCDFACFS